MIGKVKIGKNFSGICRYVFQEDKQARVLSAEGVRQDSAAHMAQDFQFQCWLRPNLGNTVLHVALALPAEDAQGRSIEQLSELLREAGRVYVREMKLENTQWALIQHFDKAHPHAHLIVNRVDNDGQTISDNFIGQRSRRVCQQLEQELGLTVAEQRGREQAREINKTNRQAVAVTPKQERAADWQRARHEVATALSQTAPYSACVKELGKNLDAYGIKTQPSVHRKKDGPTMFGIVFEKDGHRFKGSEVGKEYSANSLRKLFDQYRVQATAVQETVQEVTQSYFAQTLADLFANQAQATSPKVQPETAPKQVNLYEQQQTPSISHSQSSGLEM